MSKHSHDAEPQMADTDRRRHEMARILAERNIKSAANLSPEQRRLMMLHQLEPNMPIHQVHGYRISGHLDRAVLQQSLAELTRRHELLRSTFTDVQGRILRVVHPAAELNLYEASAELGTAPEEFVRAEVQREQQLAFDVSTGPLVRARLLRMGTDDHLLILSTHDLIADEWTADLLVGELSRHYARFVAGAAADAPPPALSYGDYGRWRLREADGEVARAQLQWWRSKLADVPFLQLPTDRARPAKKTYRSASVTGSLPASLVDRLARLAAERVTEVDTALLTGFACVLARYARQTDFAIGTRVDVRGPQWSGLVGPAGNNLVIRVDLAEDPAFGQALEWTAQQATAAQAHRDVLFGNLVDQLSTGHDVSRTPFYQVMFSSRDDRNPVNTNETINTETAGIDSNGNGNGSDSGSGKTSGSPTFAPVLLPAGATAVDLALTTSRTEAGVDLRLDYNSDLFDAVTMARLLDHLTVLLSAAVDSEAPLGQLPMLTDEEAAVLLGDWARTGEEFPATSTIHELVEQQVTRSPAAVAITCAGARVSYQELNERANQLAHHLRGLGVGPESRVSICLDRSIEMVIAMLATLKAGGAYVPLDPEYPADRLNYLVSDSDSLILITRRDLVDDLASKARPVLIDESWPEIAAEPRHNPQPSATAANLAYLIYTSGSTGQPKGVMLTHRGAVNNLTWRQRRWPLTPDDRVLHNHSFSFDPSLWATFWPLLSGAHMIITPPGQKYDSKALVRMLKDDSITVYAAVPSLNAVLMDDPQIQDCTSIRYVQSGAEALTGALQRSIFHRLPAATLINFYGPTETTVDSTAWVCEPSADPAAAPIGRPVANLRAYVLDDDARPVPVGVPGHLVFAGVGLARGYHNRPALTAGRFIPDPFSDAPGGRLYRTGDLARWRSDGTLEFLGRSDNQVKIRGYRIELGEVEAEMTRHPAVLDSVALAREDTPGDKRLIGYVVRAAGSDLKPRDVQELMAETLPSFMVPSVVMVLDDLPRTPNGKVDRRALPAPQQSVDEGEQVTPRTELEAAVQSFFGRALGVERVGITQDFFELGGSSLMLARLAGQLVQRFEVTLPVHTLFKTPTVEGVAETIRRFRRKDLGAELADQHMTQMENDATLADDIVPDGLPHANWTDPSSVLLTGATGYLGAFLLESLLRRTSADVYCLIRGDDDEHARRRLDDVLAGYLIDTAEDAHRIHAIAGDLRRPRLGLSDQVWDFLASDLDAIYHSGATVNFVYPYSALRKANVGGTQELLRLACTERLKAFQHVSTADVVLAGHQPRPLLEDESALQTPSDDPGGYTSTKWVSEKVVNIARRRGIPVNIFRPGLILGHTATGATQPSDYLIVCFRGFVQMGIVPDYPRILDAVPVDYVADAIVAISRNPEALGEIYHLFNPAPVSIMRFCDWIRTFGYEFDIVDFDQAKQKALQVPPGHPLYSMVPLIRDAEVEPQDSLDPALIHLVQPELETRNTLRALRGSGVSCPPANEEQAHQVLAYLVEQGHLESPQQLREAAQAR